MNVLKPFLFMLGLVMLCALSCDRLLAQSRRLPDLDAAQQEAQQKIQEQKEAIKRQSQTLVQEQLNPEATYQELREKAHENLRQRFEVLKDAYKATLADTLGFKWPPFLKFNALQAVMAREVARRKGNYPLGDPGTFTRFHMHGGLELFGLPLQGQALHSTEQAEGRQPMNQFSLSLDTRGLRHKIRQRIDHRIKALEESYQTVQFKDLDKLYQLEQLPALDDFTPKELQAYLSDPEKPKPWEVLEAPKDPTFWPQKAKSQLQQMAEDSLRQQRQKARAKFLEKLVQDSTWSQELKDLGLAEKDGLSSERLKAKLLKKSKVLQQELKNPEKVKKHWLKIGRASRRKKNQKQRNKSRSPLFQKLGQDSTWGPSLRGLALEKEDLMKPRQLQDKVVQASEQWQGQWNDKQKQKVAALQAQYVEKRKKQWAQMEQELEAFTQKEGISMSRLGVLFQQRDSLRHHAPDQLLAHENVRLLKSLREADHEQRYALLKEAGIISVPEWLMSRVKTISVGSHYPSLSDFTLRDARIDGLGLEVSQGSWDIGYFGSKNQRPDQNQPYQRTLRAYHASWNGGDSTRFSIIHLEGKDRWPAQAGTAAREVLSDTLALGWFGQNRVWSAQFNWKWGRLFLESELAQSLVNPGPIQGASSLGRDSAPQEGKRQGRAASLQLSYQLLEHLAVKGKWARVGPDYHSFGVPLLRNDLQGTEFSLEQRLLNGSLIIQPFYAYWTDNLKGQKARDSRIKERGVGIQFNREGLPFLTLDHRSSTIKNDRVERVSNWNMTAGYQHHVGGTQLQSVFTANVMRMDSINELPERQDRGTQRYTLEQSARFEFPLELKGQLAYSYQPERGNTPEVIRHGVFTFYPNYDLWRQQGRWLTGAGTVSYLLWGTWQNTFQAEYGQNQGQVGTKYHWGWESSVRVFGSLTGKLSLMKTQLASSDSLQAYEEWRGAMSLEVNF